MTLLEETLKVLAEHAKTVRDVVWVGSANGEYAIKWENFADIANVEYDSGYGGQEVASDLVVVGADWWLERHEYDGSEWWEYKQLPLLTSQSKTFTLWLGNTLATINDSETP